MSERSTDRLKGHMPVGNRVEKNPSCQTPSPQIVPDRANRKHRLALFYSQREQEEFEQFSKLCIFQCSLVLKCGGINPMAYFHCMCQLC